VTEIVSNTSPLVALSGIRETRLLPLLFQNVLVPNAVIHELVHEGVGWHEAEEIQSRLRNEIWIHPTKAEEGGLLGLLRAKLGAGEAEAIAIASNRSLPVLLDDLDARKTARSLKIEVVGTLGVLAKSKHCGMIAAVKPLIEAMRENGIFFSDPLIERFLRELNEL
jgi:uncharacterized protein